MDDKDIDLFESQYVVPNGVSYNSYVIMDDKIAINVLVVHADVNNAVCNLLIHDRYLLLIIFT